MPASDLGKIKMAAQVVAILALILGREQLQGFVVIGQVALWVVLVSAIVSGADYFRRFNQLVLPRAVDIASARAPQSDRKVS